MWNFFKSKIILFLIIINFCLFAYVIFNYKTIGSANKESYKINSELQSITNDHKVMIAELESRIQIMEQVLYGEITTGLRNRPTTIYPNWQRNRDDAINRRLRALESWRFRTER